MTDIFTLDGLAWQLRLDGEVLPTTWNSRGAALAAIQIERKRAARRRGAVDDTATLKKPATHAEVVAMLREFLMVTMYLPIPDADEKQRVGAVQIAAAGLLERIAA